MTDPLQPLRAKLAEVNDLQAISQLLFWDQQVMMPPNGAPARADGLATLGRLTHEHFVSDETGKLLDAAEGAVGSLDADSDDAALLRVARRDWEKARRVPPELTAEMRRAGSLALRAWGEARPKNDWESLLPHIERNLELRHRYVACFDEYDDMYDVLLDDFEPYMKTADVRAVFDRLKEGLRPLLESREEVDDSFLKRTFDTGLQREFALEVLESFGYEPTSWRLDPTAHPFASSPSSTDIRLTTHYDPASLHSLFASMHEFGHGVYERYVDPSLARSPLGSGVSLGVHESQSRTWENLVGRSRPFWRCFYPRLQELFSDVLADVDEDRFYRAVNKVSPSLIRIDADEVTYNFHVILRFELEQELINGRLPPRDLPEAWNAKMKEYLGIDVPSNSDGVMQDMHWASGLIGYFPTYALGNVMSVQIFEKAREAIPDLDERMERGEFDALRDWLAENVYRHGRRYTPQETLERATGSRIDPEPYLRYLTEKHGSRTAAA